MVDPVEDAEAAAKEAAQQSMWDRITFMVEMRTLADLTAAVPYQNKPLVAPDPADVAALDAALREVIELAFTDETIEPDSDPSAELHAPATPATVAGCTACQGACCYQGKRTHAFITPAMMVRQRRLTPEITAEALHQRYMDAIPATSTEGACLYQGPQGCVLERAHRGHVCNVFKCWNLKKLLQIEADNPGAEIAIGASPDGQSVKAVRIIDAETG